MDSLQRSTRHVKEGKTLHEAIIESPVHEKQRHVIVQWAINSKMEAFNLKDITPMFQQRKIIEQVPTI